MDKVPEITYDDAGNVIPLSRRFDSAKDDIRFDTRELGVDFDADEFRVVGIGTAPFNNVDDAVAWAERNGVTGKMTDAETNGKGEINISKNSIREMLNPGQVRKSASKEAHFSVVTKLRDIIAASRVEEVHPDYKRGADGTRSPANGINPGVTIGVAYAAVDFNGTPMRAKITLKKFADQNTPRRAYAYHVAEIEVLTGNLANPASETGPQANTSIRRDILLNGVTDVNGVPLLSKQNANVYFDTGELTPAEEEYANRADKTPTEKDMREVFGMTNDEIATAMKAAGMEPSRHTPKKDETVFQQAEALLSNPSYMAKLARAVRKFPRPVTDYENVALNTLFHQREAEVNALQAEAEDWQQAIASLGDGNTEKKAAAQSELAAVYSQLRQAKALMHEAGTAARQGASATGSSLRSNRLLLDQADYSYAGISGGVAAILGGTDRITPGMDARIREIAKDFSALDEASRELATAQLKAQAGKIVEQIKRGGKVKRATERKPGDEARRVTRNYLDALAQIEVGAAEVGGTLVGLADQQYPAWGKWLRQLGEFHCFENPDITEEECIDAILADISPFMDGVDANQVRDALTGFGHSFKQSRYEAQRLMNDLRSQARLKRQMDWMNETNTLPPATGLIRDEPSDTTRNLQQQVQARKAEIPDAGRDERRLKGVLDSAKTRVRNSIADLERAIATGEKIPARERRVREDIELRELKQRRDELRKIYGELFGTGMTDAQRIAAAERALQKSLELAMEDLARAQSGDFSRRPQRPAPTSAAIETLRGRIREVRDSIRELKDARYEFGRTPEEIAALNARKLKRRNEALERLQARILDGDIGTRKKPQPPMTPEQQKQYDELGKQLKRGREKLAELRLEAENATAPAWWRKSRAAVEFAASAQRALRATMDFSAVLRQSARLTLGHPVMGAKAFGAAWSAMRSEAALQDVNEEILSDPTVREAVEKFGLHLRPVDAADGRDVEIFHGMERNKVKIGGREYAITDIPLFGQLMLKSERHYITYLNAISAELYSAIVNDPSRFPGGATPWQKKMVADMVNIWNGSAALSEKRRQAMQEAWLNNIFWAPQLAASRIQSVLQYDIWHPLTAKGTKNAQGGFDAVSAGERTAVAKAALSEKVKSTLAALAIGMLLKWLFWDGDDDYAFKEADLFEKFLMLTSPTVGNTTVDLTGGENSVLRTAHKVWEIAVKGRVRTGSGKTVEAGSFGGPTIAGTLGRFAQGKFAPWLSQSIAIIGGRDYVGEEYTLGKAVKDLALPLTLDDIHDQLSQNGLLKSLLTVPLSLLGAGGTTYDRRRSENVVNRFRESPPASMPPRQAAEASSAVRAADAARRDLAKARRQGGDTEQAEREYAEALERAADVIRRYR